MTSAVETSLAEMRDLATLPQMRAAADAPPGAMLKTNAHLHLPPNFSAFTTVKQVVDLAAEQGVAAVGASNYYDYETYGDFANLARQRGVFPLFGLEIICLLEDLQKQGIKINDPGNPGKFYICGKGITRFASMTPEATRILGTIRRNDATRMGRLVKQLADVFEQRDVPTELTESAIIDGVANRHGCPRERVYLQERHVCQAFQERFFQLVPKEARFERLTRVLRVETKAGPEDAVKIQNEIRSHLLKTGKPGYVPETFIGFDDAFKLITELGGIVCYPTLADGANPICGFESPVEELIARLKQRKIGFAELIPIRNSPEVLGKYVKALRAAGFVVSAGTEHNTLDLIPIEPTCLNGQPVPEDLKKIFWEGTCVMAAHQFLSLHGQAGFKPFGGEELIGSLRRLGEAVIRKYREKK